MVSKMSNTFKLAVLSEKVAFPNFVLNRTEGVSRYSTANKFQYNVDPNKFMEPFVPSNSDYDHDTIYPTHKHIQCLRTKFSLEHFKAPQWKVISSILEERRDNFVIMPSGFGKSLCYQFPAVYTNGLTIVISPLISLMQDQVKLLQAVNIPACYLGPAQLDKSVIYKLLKGYYRLVYITPESALSNSGLNLLERLHCVVKITLVAVDEAHCVLNWGSYFRPAYGNLGILRLKLPSVPILALSGTATTEEKYGLFHMLGLRNPQEVCTGYDRTNIFFMARPMTKEPFGDISKVLHEDMKKYSIENGSVIIYCLTRKRSEKIAHLLNGTENPKLRATCITFSVLYKPPSSFNDISESAVDICAMGVSCSAYHAGLSNDVRKRVMDEFFSGKIKVFVATTAFGMGINKLDVRVVIHYGTSLSMEGYYQEVGRAGRDGKPALCVLYYSLADFVTHRYINLINSKSSVTYSNMEMRNSIMKRYISLISCRRKFIGNHFDKNAPISYPSPKLCCDNCSDNNGFSEYLYDLTEDAELFLKGIQSFQPKSYGTNMVVSLLVGSTDKNKYKNFKDNAYFGTGVKKKEDWWKQIALLLEIEKYIKITNVSVGPALFSKVILDVKGRQWLNDRLNGMALPIKLTLTRDMEQLLNKIS